MLASTATMIPNEQGLLAVHTLTYSLNDEYTLILYQDFYADKRSPIQSSPVDGGAEIVRHKPHT